MLAVLSYAGMSPVTKMTCPPVSLGCRKVPTMHRRRQLLPLVNFKAGHKNPAPSPPPFSKSRQKTGWRWLPSLIKKIKPLIVCSTPACGATVHVVKATGESGPGERARQ